MTQTTPSPVAYGAPAYKVCLTRLDGAGRQQHIDIDYYGALRELLADLEAAAEKRGWLKESDPDGE